MLRILSLALAALLLLAPWGTSPASATPPAASYAAAAEPCPPFQLDNADHVRAKLADADTVFEGRVASVARVAGAGSTEFRHGVRVTQVYVGGVAAQEQTQVITLPSGQDGRGRLPNGERFLFFANDRSDGGQIVERCNGTTRLQRALPDSQAALLDQLVTEAQESARDVGLDEPEAGVSETPSLKRLALPGAIVSLVGLLALLGVIAVGARRP